MSTTVIVTAGKLAWPVQDIMILGSRELYYKSEVTTFGKIVNQIPILNDKIIGEMSHENKI